MLDLAEDEAAESIDAVPGADDTAEGTPERRRLLDFARRADSLAGDADTKLATCHEAVTALLADGYNPVVFCRFIATAEYVAAHLRESLGTSAAVAYVTGALPPAEREARIAAFAATSGRLVLVATDCLSEGVNLQEHFQAVVHYDLAWNPTRHEQRDGRVDRFGQRWDTVRSVTLIGADNQIDEIVMRVLLRKHEQIRRQLGISVPVPDTANQVVEAVMEELLVTETAAEQEALISMEDLGRSRRADLHREWDSTAARERQSRTRFAQAGIKPDDVAAELAEVRASLGSHADITGFARESLDALGGVLTDRDYGFDAVTGSLPAGLRDALPAGHTEPLPFHHDLPVPRRHAHLDRTDASVRATARYLLDSALDPSIPEPRPARRCGAIRTDAVTRRTTLLLLRFRFHLNLPGRDGPRPLVAEDAAVLAYHGRPDDPTWLSPDDVEALLAAAPTGNIAPELAREDLARIVDRLDALQPHLDAAAQAAAERLRDSHVRVRKAARRTGGGRISVRAHTPADVLGVYLYLPPVGGGGR